MPYHIIKSGKGYYVENKQTKKLYHSFCTN